MNIDKDWFVNRLSEKGLSQRQLAKKMELDPSAITHILTGKRKLQLAEAQKMSRYIGVTVDEILSHAGVQLRHSTRPDLPIDRDGR